jgi:integrase
LAVEGSGVGKRSRGNGEGSIYQRSRDGKWVTAVTLPDGKRRTWVSGTWREAHKKLQAARKAISEQLPIAPAHLTVGKYLDEWLEVASHNLRPTTTKSYEVVIRCHLVPSFGRIKLGELTPQHIQAHMAAKRSKGLSARSVQYQHAVLRRALNQAVKWGMVPRNVATLVDVPRAPRGEMRALTGEQAKELITALEGTALEHLLILALLLGLRRSELLALRWEDVDLEKRKLRVTGALHRTDNGLERLDTKTTKSHRAIALPNVAVQLFTTRRKRQIEERLLAGPRWQNTGYIFTSRVGTPIEPRNVNREFYKVRERAGLGDVRLHDLRHSTASILHAYGVPIKLISDLLGHASTRITDEVYTHIFEESKQQVADAIDAIFGYKTSS